MIVIDVFRRQFEKLDAMDFSAAVLIIIPLLLAKLGEILLKQFSIISLENHVEAKLHLNKTQHMDPRE